MTVEQLLAEVSHLDESALVQLKQQITQREHELHSQSGRSAEEWGIVLEQFLEGFWADTPIEAQNEIVEAIRIKNIPLERDK